MLFSINSLDTTFALVFYQSLINNDDLRTTVEGNTHSSWLMLAFEIFVSKYFVAFFFFSFFGWKP